MSKEVRSSMEELENSIEIIHDTTLALEQAIFNGDMTANNYEWAFIGLMRLIGQTKQEANRLKNMMFELSRKEK